ncbi:nuclease-related domain-containing protein [Neisseria iguanae]|uniref:NERD nuclease n=1 Tax=Neisseria iguanae TaxID=90242 RepID=A0A2P7TYY3_9NEIS|nr:nuclease-related domain-containing protein [Neisseria iguanae]PSJ79917.1 NERD nuclease [Neisseria iguanae]
MLVKSADDKSSRLELLKKLKDDDSLNSRQRKWAEEQYWALKTGIQGEKEAAYYLNSIQNDNEYSAVFHDLRIELDDEVAQIDHLVVNHLLAILYETKNFNGDLTINEQGEFLVRYKNGLERGIPSPLEQSYRHEKVLKKLFDMLGIKSIVGNPLRIVHVVLLSPKSIINRPNADKFPTHNIIKADALRQWRKDFMQKEFGVMGFASLMGNMLLRPASFLKTTDRAMRQHTQEIAEKILGYHVPDPNLLKLPDFMKSEDINKSEEISQDSKLLCASCQKKISRAEYSFCQKNSDRFDGKSYCREHQQAFQNQQIQPVVAEVKTQADTVQAVCCDYPGCGVKLSEAVIDFCRSEANKKWFGGKLYCVKHQRMINYSRKKSAQK